MNDYGSRMYDSYNYINNYRNDSFFSENEGFAKGNMQRSIYDGYKNYNPSVINPSNDKDRLLLEIQKYGFVLTDLGLYLDLHPNDNEVLKIYNDNRSKYLRLISEFNNNYYPLMSIDNNSKDKYRWVEGYFPFVGGK